MIDLMLYSVIEEVMISAVVVVAADDDNGDVLTVADANRPLKQS
jgi:hypothetical protein